MDIIIGGGITGLSYALFKNNDDYLILEKESEVGGYCKTTERNGFIWDYSGHFFHFQHPEIKQLIMSKLYEKGDIVEIDKCTHIKYKDLYIDYPFQKNIHQLSKEEFIDCLFDLFATEDKSISTFKEMLYNKFGCSIAEKFLIPYNEKLYACDLNLLDKDAMGRFFPYADRKQIINNFRHSNNDSYNNSFVYPRKGAIQYVNEITSRLKQSNIKVRVEVVAIYPEQKKILLNTGELVEYDNLISTMPFPSLLKLSGLDYDPDIYSWNKVLVFNLGFNYKGNNEIDHWIYFPENDYCFYRVGFYDNILKQNRASMYVELGFKKEDVINPNEWLGRVLYDLKKAKLINESHILIDYEWIIMDPAYVHITQKSIYDVKIKKEMLSKYRIYSIGRYGSWTYCSIEDNIKEAYYLRKKNENK